MSSSTITLDFNKILRVIFCCYFSQCCRSCAPSFQFWRARLCKFAKRRREIPCLVEQEVFKFASRSHLTNSTTMTLNKYKFSEKEEYSHDIAWNLRKVFVIDSKEKLCEAETYIRWKRGPLYIDMEGHYFGNTNAKIGLIQVCTSDGNIFLFDTADTVKCKKGSLEFIKFLIQSKNWTKVLHASSGDISALDVATSGNIQQQNIFDTQVAQQVIDKPNGEGYSLDGYGIEDVYKRLTGKAFPDIKVKDSGNQNKWLEIRPLSERMIKYAVADVICLSEIYKTQVDYLNEKPDLKEKILKITERNIENNKKAEIEPHGNSRNLGIIRENDVGQSTLPWSASRGELEQAESPGIGTTLAVGAAVALVGGALSMLWLGRRRNNQ